MATGSGVRNDKMSIPPISMKWGFPFCEFAIDVSQRMSYRFGRGGGNFTEEPHGAGQPLLVHGRSYIARVMD